MELKKTSAQELKDTVPFMLSDDYKERFISEYKQTKIRHRRLRNFNTTIEAAKYLKTSEPSHDCPYELLKEQQRIMGEYLRILEIRAIIEGVDLT